MYINATSSIPKKVWYPQVLPNTQIEETSMGSKTPQKKEKKKPKKEKEKK
jgi:hypothetical protein